MIINIVNMDNDMNIEEELAVANDALTIAQGRVDILKQELQALGL